MSFRLQAEIDSFQSLWDGGYYEGDPLDPVAPSRYGSMGYMSVLHATYLRCIKPYITAETAALEIGPGRGAWTKCMLAAREVSVLDVLSAEHNRFFEYVGHQRHVHYIQVQGFDCQMLPDNHFTYMFSFGCLCHVSFEGITAYASNLHRKLKSGSNCFWLVADYNKYNHVIAESLRFNIWNVLLSQRRWTFPLRVVLKFLARKNRKCLLSREEDDRPSPGRWYHAGVERVGVMLAEQGYRVIDLDVGTSFRDPIVHFVKP